MAKANLTTKLKALKPFNLVILFAILAIVLVLGIVLAQKLVAPKPGTISEDQIKIQKGEKIVIVNESGLIEYRTQSGVFYDVWDASRVYNFFESMRAKARVYLANPPPPAEQSESGYWVTLYLDGKEVTFWVSGDDEELNEVYDEFPDEDEDEEGSLSDAFDDFFDDQSTDETQSPTPTPTPTPLIVSAEEGGDDDSGGGGQEVVECGLYGQNVTDRTVISNALCINVSPTPTPTP